MYTLFRVWIGPVIFTTDKGECDRLEERIDEVEDGTDLVLAESEVELEFL